MRMFRLLLVLLLVVMLLVDVGECKKKGKKAKKGNKKAAKAKAAGNDKAAKKKKTKKDWSSMSEKDFDKIAGDMLAEDLDSDDEFYEDRMKQAGREEELEERQKQKMMDPNYKSPPSPGGQITFGEDGTPQFADGFDMEEFKSTQHRGKPQLMFIKLKPEVYEDPDFDKVALTTRWNGLLSTASVECQMYDIDKDTVLVSLQRGQFATDVKKFALLQPETLYFEHENAKSFPDDVDPASVVDPTPPPPPNKRKKGKKKKAKAKAKAEL